MRFLSLTYRNIKEIYRDPISILLGLAMPIGLLFLFSSIYTKSKINNFSPQMLTPGIVIFSFAFIIMFSAMLLAKDRQFAFLTRLLTTPLRSSDFILAYLLPFIPLALLQIAICFIIGKTMGATYVHVGEVLVILLLSALTCICIGITLGALFTINQVSGIGSILITVISIFSGAWMDLNMVGGVFSTIGYAMPFAHAIDATKELLKGASLSDVASHIYWVVAYAVAFFFLSIWAFNLKTKRG